VVETVVLATRNKGKLAELAALLRDFGVEVKGLDDFPDVGEIEETGSSFAENALIKAEAVSRATGLLAVADDSGLEVDALDGAPGIYSARYAGEGAAGESSAGESSMDEKNNRKLLTALAGVEDARRTARFRCALAARSPNGKVIRAEGAWEGRILRGQVGSNGFGYDPLFYDPEIGMTAAQMESGVKSGRSHRGRAMRALLTAWPAFLGDMAVKI
jgi:XTP/dITP diphosphohydrolase